MRKLRMFLVAGLFLTPFIANAQDGIASAESNPMTGQFRVQFTNGTIAVADSSTQRIYITKPSGAQFEVTFADAVATEPDPAKRQALMDNFQQSLVDPGHMIALVPTTRVATDDSFWPHSGNNPPGDTNTEQKVGGKKHAISASALGPTYGPFGQCELGPCSPSPFRDPAHDQDQFFQVFYSNLDAGWDKDKGGGGTITQQDIQAYDRQRWEQSRQSACNDKWVSVAETAATGVATVVSCAFVETGVGAIGCGAGIAGYSAGLYKVDQANKQCQAGYPGVGKW